MKTVTINGLEFAVHEDAKFLSLADSVPEKIGDTVSCSVYDLRIDPPQLITKKDIVADAEYIAMMEQIKRYERITNE